MVTETFNVGQKVWFEPDDEREKGFYATIIKVGRTYYTIDKWNIKFTKDTLYHCEYPNGHLFNSEQAAKNYNKARRMFYCLKNQYSLKPTLEQMKAIYKILDLEFPNDE